MSDPYLRSNGLRRGKWNRLLMPPMCWIVFKCHTRVCAWLYDRMCWDVCCSMLFQRGEGSKQRATAASISNRGIVFYLSYLFLSLLLILSSDSGEHSCFLPLILHSSYWNFDAQVYRCFLSILLTFFLSFHASLSVHRTCSLIVINLVYPNLI